MNTALPTFGQAKVKAEPKQTELTETESESLAEVEQAKAAFKQAGKDEQSRIAEQTNSEFWFSVYFATAEQRDAFLKNIDALKLLEEQQHINGRKLAQLLMVPLTESPKQRPFRICPKMAALSLPKGETS